SHKHTSVLARGDEKQVAILATEGDVGDPRFGNANVFDLFARLVEVNSATNGMACGHSTRPRSRQTHWPQPCGGSRFSNTKIRPGRICSADFLQPTARAATKDYYARVARFDLIIPAIGGMALRGGKATLKLFLYGPF